ncbi:iron ABC transporter permease [Agromyces protaetiae]|uniref:Iron ABC transporter permease n=1 Tax=Agromyces protaetiae TaxID=2509455 RepID=A0A4P6FGK1_9MICO|nr:iron ABC transporter permease [Agromyces protaetiae]
MFSTPAAGAAVAAVAAVRAHRRRRLVLVLVAGILVAIAIAFVALSLGAAAVTPDRVLVTLLGFGDDRDRLVVFRLRLPRIVAALVVGAAFALAGAIFQSVLRNPLASPDILGVSGGASLGAVFAILGLGLGGAAVAGFAFAGGFAVALVIWLAAWKQGLHGVRFVLVGVGMAYVSGAAVAWLLARSDVRQAQQTLMWTVGSVADVRGAELWIATGVIGALAVAVALVAPRLAPLSTGDDRARSLGVGVDATRIVLLVLAVTLVASATSVAGPVAFVALVAPAIARRLTADGSPALAVSVVIGATLTLAADVVGQFALPGVTAPVGIVTGLVGAPYLLWLLARTERSARA